MRCKNHYTDLSSIVGVCASCLRERLFPLLAAQEQAQPQAQTLEQKNCNPVIPRSVSPYISSRKTDNSASSIINQHNRDRHRHRHRHRSLPYRRFFSTPQVVPTTESYNPCRKKQHSFIGFSFLSNLFRSKKRNSNSDLDPDPRSSVSVSNYRGSCVCDDTATSAMSSPFWISNLKKQPYCSSKASTVSGAGAMRRQYCPDRGLSPVRYSDCDGAEDDFRDGSGGYETCESRKQTPWRTPAHPSVRCGGGHGKNVSGISFCLSPLVRASPCRRHWNQKGVAPVDGGEIRAPVKPNLSNAKAFCANRSRKIADFGRFATNR
ncbi:hypothetical protein L1987_41947 [Smallanthus sonchifolius]|uniref:Uncharacterized protein n=1 Tax=Smallanthus sonchifolius TaxID=185202 RepID=A0ACB9GW71_9ASTR|nr:hypothetical protein L1987_41947 [Smallanthus sonchifolius]